MAIWKMPTGSFLGTENLIKPCLHWHNLLGQARLEQGWLWPCHVDQIYFSERPCKEKPEISQKHCTFVFCWGAWNRDGVGTKIPLWVVVSFLTQGSGPRPLCPLHLPLFPTLNLGPARLFPLSWSAEHTLYCFSFAFTYVILLPPRMSSPHLPPSYLTSQSTVKCSLALMLATSPPHL